MKTAFLKGAIKLGFVGILLFFSSCRQQPLTTANAPILIPQPLSFKVSEGGMDYRNITQIALPKEWFDATTAFIETSALLNLGDFKPVDKATASAIIVKKVDDFTTEEYALDTRGGQITLLAHDGTGVINGLQTLQQLILQAHNGNTELAALQLHDRPRFGYRGLMIDCARHFWKVDELKETIRQMAFFKLNKLHLHLTDNNAWRVEILSYPELTKIGTHYEDYPELSDKFYTQDDLREVVRYAGQFNIEVIPEIDIPGHATALLAALPQLACHEGEYAPYPEEMPAADRKTGKGNMICVGNPETYQVLENVIQEIGAIFPSKKIHLGGDEVPTHAWQTCPKCQKLYAAEAMDEWHELQDIFTKFVADIAHKYGKTMVGWGEINDHNAASKEDVVMIWRNYGHEKALAAMERDIPVIMAPQHGCYYDWGYAGNATRKVYEWEPFSEAMLALDKQRLVLGGQACLWTERITTQERVEEMLYPRLTALAEVLWSPKEKRNWDNYLTRLEQFNPLMEAIDINYYVDDAINEKEFHPQSEKPALFRHAQLSTNVPNHGNYHLEYAFDGKSNTFYWGGRSLSEGDWYQLNLGEPVALNEIEVLTGDSKDYVQHANLMVSEDGKSFSKVAEFTKNGMAKASIKGKSIRAIRIDITKDQTNWPVIREIKIK